MNHEGLTRACAAAIAQSRDAEAVHRPIDPERAGGTGNAAPKAAGKSAPPMTPAEAAVWVEQHVRWRAVRSAVDDVLIALDDEVKRLAAIHAALPEIIRCSAGKGAACDEDRYGWASCCQTRLKLQQLGLIEAPEHAAEENDNA